MIGDGLVKNIKGASKVVSRSGAEWITCLVESDVYEAGTAFDVGPNWIGKDVGCAVRDALRSEGWVDDDWLGGEEK